MCGWTDANALLRSEIVKAHKADILSVNESHLSANNTISVDGYRWFGNNRRQTHVNATRTFGGVGILVNNKLDKDFLISVTSCNYDGILGVKFVHRFSDFSFVLFSCYLPPENSPWGRDSSSFFGTLLSELYILDEVDTVIFCGDVNARIGALSDTICGVDDSIPIRQVIDTYVNQHGHFFIEFLIEARMHVLNGRYSNEHNDFTSVSTRGKAVVDYFAIPHDSIGLCRNFTVERMSAFVERHNLLRHLNERSKIPDHSMLTFEFLARPQYSLDSMDSNQPVCNISNKPVTTRKYRLDSIPQDFMQSETTKRALLLIIERIESNIETQNNINSIYTSLCDCIITCMNDSVPYFDCSKHTRKRYKSQKPFWNDELHSLWKEMRDKEKDFLKCNRHVSGNLQYSYLRSQFKHAQHCFDKRLRFHERKFKLGLQIEIEEVCTENPRRFWEHIDRLGPANVKKNIPMEVYRNDNTITSDPSIVLNTWQHEFSSLYSHGTESMENFDEEFYRNITHHKQNLENNLSDPLYEQNQQLNKNFTFTEVKNAVMKGKNKKATGIDNIPYDVLKHDNIIDVLVHLFQMCFDSGKIPSVWRQSIILPIPKCRTNDARVPLNYRGISLLSVISKLYSSVLNHRLINFLDNNDKLVDEQNGFRKDRSCQDHVFVLTSIIRNRLNNDLPTFVTFIDLQKAFDFVVRNVLLYKLLMNNIDGKMYNSISAMYSNTLACVKVNENYTDWFDTVSGVRQGDNLSPTLFAIFINDLADGIKELNCGIQIGGDNVSVLLYADDIAVISNNEENMQKMLDFISSWCKKWRLLINKKKSHFVHFRKRGTNISNFRFHLSGTPIDFVHECKYLGVMFEEFLNFETMSCMLAESANRALGKICSKFKSIKNMGFQTFTKLYESCVVPIMDYCSAIWGYSNYVNCDKIQNRALRFFLGVHRFAPTTAVVGDTGWISSKTRHWINMVRYWNRLINMDHNRLCKRIFLWDNSLCSNNWNYEVNEIFDQLDVNVIEDGGYCDLVKVNDKIEAEKVTDWANKVNSQPKLRTYKTFKSTYQRENYLLCNLDRSTRSLYVQFRFGILPLRIETGRYRGESVEDRKCVYCTQNSVEDEIHFLLYCSLYDDHRNTLLDIANRTCHDFNGQSDTRKLAFLVNDVSRSTAKFISRAYKKRQSVTYEQR